MKRKILIGIVVVAMLLATVAGMAIFSSGNLGIAEAKKLTGSDGMIVFYTTGGNITSEYLFWCQLEGTDIVDQGDKWDVHSEQGTWYGVSKTDVDYDYFRYKKIASDYEGPVADLNLQPLGGAELPKSQHIGKLTAVNPALAKPATVTRKYMGQLYDVQCLVSQTVVDMWLAGTLQVGDYVVVSYIDENPDTAELSIAIVVDKVYESWLP